MPFSGVLLVCWWPCSRSLYSDSFVSDAPNVVDFLTNGDYRTGGYGDWGVGFGQLRIFFNNETRPSLTVPLNLEQTILMDNGCVHIAIQRGPSPLLWCPISHTCVWCGAIVCRRAYIGFTASTGDSVWQVHDVLAWHFTQLREDWVAIREAHPRLV
jgi:hypothetical protein